MAAREYDILTIGDMNVDLVFDLGDVMPQFGQVEQWVPDYFQEMGGSACIFACQAAKLGMRVAILGRVGADSYGELMLHRLGESGVDTRFVQVDPKLKTGLGLALCRPDGDRAILTYAGSLNAVYPEDISDDFLRLGRHFHYCSYYLQTNLAARDTWYPPTGEIIGIVCLFGYELGSRRNVEWGTAFLPAHGGCISAQRARSTGQSLDVRTFQMLSSNWLIWDR